MLPNSDLDQLNIGSKKKTLHDLKIVNTIPLELRHRDSTSINSNKFVSMTVGLKKKIIKKNIKDKTSSQFCNIFYF